MEFIKTAETVGSIWFIIVVHVVTVWEEFIVENVEILKGVQHKVNTIYSVCFIFSPKYLKSVAL